MDDVDALLEIFADAQAMTYYPSTKSRQETEAWIQWNLDNYAKYGFGLWAVVLKSTGICIGDCGITYQRIGEQPEAEIGYHIQRAYWGQGFATEAARACLDYGFRVLGLRRLTSIVHPENWASRTVATRIHA